MLTKKGIKSIHRQTDRQLNWTKLLSNKKHVISSIVLIGLLIVFMSYSFAALTPTPSITVPSTTLSYSDKEEGSWQFTKTAKWISKDKARINIKLETIEKPRADYTDVILVLDTSGSMQDSKLTQVQSDVNELINDTIPKGNKVALITFNDTATVVNGFTDNASLLQESINNITVAGETNYYQALVKVDDVLSTYEKLDNRDCVILFLTDGLPTIDTPNEVSQYKYLKSKYSYLDINGIQYEFGDNILASIKNITDTQYIASQDSLNEFLYKASLATATYDEFTLTDVVDTNYFNLNNVTDITTTSGKTSIVDNQIIWNLNGLKSGLNAELTIDINLNDDLIEVGGLYPTHTNTNIDYKIGITSTTETTAKTTSLKNNYTVSYDMNTPQGCGVSSVPNSKEHLVFDTVTIDDSTPTCEGYQFKEWKITTKNVQKISSNKFIMPESDVKIKAIWKKLSVKKSSEGKISRIQTLYKIIADSSRGSDIDIDFSKSPSNAGSGVYTIDGTESDKYPVHYYRGNIENNNVLFAGFCWKMVRTTSTGGVKLIYNGIYNESNKCNNTKNDSQIANSKFSYNPYSPAGVGYMYGTLYNRNSHSSTIYVFDRKYNPSTYYYGTSVTYSDGVYTLQNAEEKSWSDNYSTLTGYYTCMNTSTTCSTVYYIAGTDNRYQYILSLSKGETDPTTKTIILGKNVTNNGNNTYTLTNKVTVKRVDWYANYDTYKNYYICKDLSSTTCDNKYLIASTDNTSITYDDTYKFVYGNDVTWDGEKYTLVDTYTSELGWDNDRTKLAKKYHYTCFNTTGECTDVYYIDYFGDNLKISYLTLSSGKNIEDAKNEMFTNTNDSTIKEVIDSWYKDNMTPYTEKLEDTIWCNDRTLYSGSLKGKDEDAGTDYSYFSAHNRIWTAHSPSVECPNQSRDGFTVSTDSGGNGALTYPVSLLTADEEVLAGKNSMYLYTGRWYWLLSPIVFNDSARVFTYYGIYGTDTHAMVTNTDGTRPSVSLAPGTRTTGGDGTVYDPYIIE